MRRFQNDAILGDTHMGGEGCPEEALPNTWSLVESALGFLPTAATRHARPKPGILFIGLTHSAMNHTRQ